MWYDSIKKSPLTPPPIVFSIVWPILYTLMFISLVLYVYTYSNMFPKKNSLLSLGVLLFFIQLIFNLMWSPIFFRYHQICLSILIILAILVFLLLTMIQFYKISPTSFYLLLPYLIWSCFALYLNIYICVSNP